MDDEPSVDARQRFLTDLGVAKVIMSLSSMYANAQHPDDEALDEMEIPQLSRNHRVLLLNGIYDLFAEVIGEMELGGEVDEEEFDDEEAAVKNFGKEVAKDKRMSTFYKAFMGDMRALVGPWHTNRNVFLTKWGDMGNGLYNKSPSDEAVHAVRLAVVKDEPKKGSEEAATIGGESALASKVSRAIAEMGFVPIEQPENDDAAWVKNGADDGHPEKQVILVRREDHSYLIALTNVSKYSAYGKYIKRRVLDDDATPENILRTIAYMYDLMTQG